MEAVYRVEFKTSQNITVEQQVPGWLSYQPVSPRALSALHVKYACSVTCAKNYFLCKQNRRQAVLDYRG